MSGSAANVPGGRPSVRRRLAAVVALVIPLLILQMAIDLVRRPFNLAVLIVCIAGGVLSVWYLMTRRGKQRWVALVAAIPLLPTACGGVRLRVSWTASRQRRPSRWRAGRCGRVEVASPTRGVCLPVKQEGRVACVLTQTQPVWDGPL